MEIQRLPQGGYIISSDRESITLYPQEMLELMDWLLLHARELEVERNVSAETAPTFSKDTEE